MNTLLQIVAIAILGLHFLQKHPNILVRDNIISLI